MLFRISTPENAEATVARGRALWDSIYAPHHDKLHDKLGAYHPDFICESSILRSEMATVNHLRRARVYLDLICLVLLSID